MACGSRQTGTGSVIVSWILRPGATRLVGILEILRDRLSRTASSSLAGGPHKIRNRLWSTRGLSAKSKTDRNPSWRSSNIRNRRVTMSSDKQQVLNRFLVGRANDAEVATAEAMLATSETVSATAVIEAHDDLLQAFQQKPREELEQAHVRAFAEQVGQRLVSSNEASDDWRRCLDPPGDTESIGRIGRFAVRQLLARGGTGLIFEALEGDAGHRVCLKLLQPHRAQHFAARQRFMGEAKTATRLQHPRIVPIYEVALHGELPYLVMPLLAGHSLRARLHRDGRLDPKSAVRVARQVAEGLEHAHGLGILHRDIKPDNLWILPNGEVQILDFGLARTADDQQPITLAGTVLGTPSYMSPEQVTGKPLDGRSDLFSLGVVLWELLTGHSPFRRDNLFSTMMSVATDELDIEGRLDRETLPAPLCDLLGRLLAKAPDQRPGSARELIQALDQVELALTSPPSLLEVPASLAGRRGGGGVRLVVATLAGAFCCWLGLLLWQSQDKGTLVVETHDEQVEVRIHGHRVTVTDPVTEKVYEVGIGATPLPSGVYLLEASVEGKDLEFSSQTIVIRRGQKTLVTVRLRPAIESGVGSAEVAPDKATPDTADNAESDLIAQSPQGANPVVDNSGGDSSSEPIARDLIVDRSYAPEVEDTLAARLDDLPAQGNLDEYAAQAAISPTALVANPVKLPSYDTWSLEVPSDDKLTWKANADQSLWVGVGGRVQDMVWVADPNGQVRYVIPTSGTPVNAFPAPTQPRLLATIAWRGSPLMAVPSHEVQTTDSPTPQYRLQIWRLNAGSATLLSTAASDSYHVVWDGSYRLLFKRDGGVWAYRLDNGQTYPLVESVAGDLVESSLSPSRRWVAFREYSDLGTQIQVHDLHRGQPLGEFNNNGYKLQWHEDRLVVDGLVTQPIELWQVAPLKLLQRIDPPQTTELGSGRQLRVEQAIDAVGQRVARLSEHGELTIMRLFDLKTATIVATQLRGRGHYLAWQPDGTLLIQNSPNWYLWRGGLDDVHGRVTEYVGKIPSTSNRQFRLQSAGGAQFPSTTAPNHFLWQPGPASRLSADERTVGQYRILSQLPLSTMWDRNWTQWLQSSSPDGAYQLRDNRLWSTETNEVLYDFGVFGDDGGGRSGRPGSASSGNGTAIDGASMVGRSGPPGNRRLPQLLTAWSADSRWLVVAGRRRVDPTVVLDLTTRQPLDLTKCFPETVLNRPVQLLQVMGSNFWLTFEGSREIFELDPERAVGKVVPLPAPMNRWPLSHLAAPFLFFRQGPAEFSTNPALTQKFARAKLDDGLWTEFVELTIGINDELLVSPTGLAYLQIVNPPGTGLVPQPDGSWIKDPGGEPHRLTLAQWPAGEAGGQPQRQLLTWEWRMSDSTLPQWHPSGRSLIFTVLSGVGVIDLESGKYHEYGGWTGEQRTPAVATDYGWLVARPDQFMALGHDGQKLAVLPLNHSLRSESSRNAAELGGLVASPQDQEIMEKHEPEFEVPRGTWILADGRVHPQAEGTKYFVGRRGSEFVTIPWTSQTEEPRLPTLPTYAAKSGAWLLELPD